jgi:hypothetical protein
VVPLGKGFQLNVVPFHEKLNVDMQVIPKRNLMNNYKELELCLINNFLNSENKCFHRKWEKC